MNVPAELKYTKEHEWIRVEGEEAYVGITDYAQSQLGDIVFVEVETEGDNLEAGDTFGSIEAVKTVSDLYTGLCCICRFPEKYWNSIQNWKINLTW